MYNFGKQTKEKARQQKQLEKAAKRMAAKQQKANLEAGVPGTDSETDVQPLVDDNGKNPA
jgi:hypothetical protein